MINLSYCAVMNAHENMRYYAVIGIVESFLKLTVAFVCVYTSGDKQIVYGMLMAAILLIMLIIMKLYFATQEERLLDINIIHKIKSYVR